MNSNTVRERHHAIFLQYKIENFFMQKKYIYTWNLETQHTKNIYLKICFLYTPTLNLSSVR